MPMGKYAFISPSSDNAIVRMRGTNDSILEGGANAPTYDDAGNITLAEGATINGRDLAALSNTDFTQRVISATSDTLSLDDFPASGGKLLLVGNASAVGITVPDNADVALPLNRPIVIIATDDGAVTISADDDATITPTPGFTTTLVAGDGATATLVQTAADKWYLSGSLESAE